LKILALDSALSSCSAAVIMDGEISAEIFESRMRGHAERLVPMCRDVCARAAVDLTDMDYIAVTRGPGTFTGVRIGLAAAKGLALALGAPLIGLTTLEVVARNAAEALGDGFRGRIAVGHDARRSEAYLQLFSLAGGRVSATSNPAAVPLPKVGEFIGEEVAALVGTGAALIRSFLTREVADRMIFPEINDQPNAGTIGRMAAEKLASGEMPQTVTPLYLRAPDAIAAKPVVYPFQNR